MGLQRWAKRRDATEPAIVKELRQYGLQVHHQDVPDLIVRQPGSGKLLLIEIDGITKNRRRKPGQLKFLSEWQVPRVKTAFEALALFGITCSSFPPGKLP